MPTSDTTNVLRRFWPLAAAACLGALISLAPSNDTPDPPDIPDLPIVTIEFEFDENAPSIYAYRKALLDSPEALDRLLDHHAQVLLTPAEPAQAPTG